MHTFSHPNKQIVSGISTIIALATTGGSWDATATIAVIAIVAAILIGGISIFFAFKSIREGRSADAVFKLSLGFPTILLFVGLKVYGQIGSEVLTFVVGAIIGYVFGGIPLQLGGTPQGPQLLKSEKLEK